jgi:hypothetical protein
MAADQPCGPGDQEQVIRPRNRNLPVWIAPVM